MNREEAEKMVSALNASDKLKASMMRTYDALQERWSNDQIAASTVYQIDIPAQTLRIYGEGQARHVLNALKSLKLSGTYRKTKGATNERSGSQQR
ncbi:hypothetical protein [Collinsella stercoris]|uniref:Uncharacterized protein n=1 Tax=Collinsella stercoris DSM 13279 TaxID=445975 RepID=B6GDJ4_9ACTN|nr:hypothetical protein [Collinsella stercoris]EEA89633.1 hypothetical protein COLSTE_02175 [Collinsella stercoris DSM 13279]UEA45186.1 hypothetical protein LK434_08640 [Collinsella stercoris DSM 13279]UWP12289.1 hypothetical protein NQ498_03390 [Collinsella stercoris]